MSFVPICPRENAFIRHYPSEDDLPQRCYCDLCDETHEISDREVALIYHRAACREAAEHPTQGQLRKSGDRSQPELAEKPTPCEPLNTSTPVNGNPKLLPQATGTNININLGPPSVSLNVDSLAAQRDAQKQFESEEQSMSDKPITILMFSADPDPGNSPLGIPRESREIREWIRNSDHRDRIQFEEAPAARSTDFLQRINEVEPDIVHFSGHGSTSGILTTSDGDGPQPLKTATIGRLFESAGKNVRLVVMNSCFSEPQADQIVTSVECAIGTKSSISDDSAIEFSKALYGAIGYGHSVKKAFNQGKLAVEMQNTDEENIFQLREGTSVNSRDVVFLSPRES